MDDKDGGLTGVLEYDPIIPDTKSKIWRIFEFFYLISL